MPDILGAKHNGLVINNEYYNFFFKYGKETDKFIANEPVMAFRVTQHLLLQRLLKALFVKCVGLDRGLQLELRLGVRLGVRLGLGLVLVPMMKLSIWIIV